MRELTDSLHLFISSARLSYISLFAWVDTPGYILFRILAPLSEMLFFVYLGISATGRDTIGFYIIGNALRLTALNGIFGVTVVIGGERDSGTLIYLIGSPANRLAIFLGRALFHISDGIITAILGFLWGILLGLDLSQTNLFGLTMVIIVTAISTSGLGLLMGSVSLIALNVGFLNNTIYFLLLVLSGANVPLNQLPSLMQVISLGLPLTRSIQAARLLVAGAPMNEVGALLMGELAVGLAYALLGFGFFRWLEFRAKVHGTLETV